MGDVKNLAGLLLRLNGLCSPLTTVTPGCLHKGLLLLDVFLTELFLVDDDFVALDPEDDGVFFLEDGDLNEFLKFSDTRFTLITLLGLLIEFVDSVVL